MYAETCPCVRRSSKLRKEKYLHFARRESVLHPVVAMTSMIKRNLDEQKVR